ncbi:hypothetical protein P154DRAFT_35919 [Amniculicola lignicola CBS 123094]|uniref:DUF7730 domain-containing protein n=1 Tax=Amniculicola lignicola CBS 123094 TaxID=1392246 RepID=A0A6A5X1Z5_9PLEO|nr:hypothetical protein P154DRAFT_35919 [Amniculicola lignicola CBS 123094]
MIVYEFIIGDDPFLISDSSWRGPPSQKVHASRLVDEAQATSSVVPCSCGDKNVDILPLLQSCRAVYTEMIDIVYSHPNFHFNTTNSFLIFSTYILPAGFSNLTHIDMPSLERFTTDIICPSFFGPIKYRSIIDQNSYRNPVLPSASQLLEDGLRLPKWWLTCYILSSIPKLKRLRIDLNNASFTGQQGGLRSACMSRESGKLPKELVEEVVQGLEMLDGKGLEEFVVWWRDMPQAVPQGIEGDAWSALRFIPGLRQSEV